MGMAPSCLVPVPMRCLGTVIIRPKYSGRCSELHRYSSSGLACLPVGNAALDLTMAQWRLGGRPRGRQHRALVIRSSVPTGPKLALKNAFQQRLPISCKGNSSSAFLPSLSSWLIAHFDISQCFGSQLQVPQANVGRVLDRPTGISQVHLRRPNR